jgi:hypothetical protein
VGPCKTRSQHSSKVTVRALPPSRLQLPTRFSLPNAQISVLPLFPSFRYTRVLDKRYRVSLSPSQGFPSPDLRLTVQGPMGRNPVRSREGGKQGRRRGHRKKEKETLRRFSRSPFISHSTTYLPTYLPTYNPPPPLAAGGSPSSSSLPSPSPLSSSPSFLPPGSLAIQSSLLTLPRHPRRWRQEWGREWSRHCLQSKRDGGREGGRKGGRKGGREGGRERGREGGREGGRGP